MYIIGFTVLSSTCLSGVSSQFNTHIPMQSRPNRKMRTFQQNHQFFLLDLFIEYRVPLLPARPSSIHPEKNRRAHFPVFVDMHDVEPHDTNHSGIHCCPIHQHWTYEILHRYIGSSVHRSKRHCTPSKRLHSILLSCVAPAEQCLHSRRRETRVQGSRSRDVPFTSPEGIVSERTSIFPVSVSKFNVHKNDI